MLERGQMAWPVEGCAALLRVLDIDPEKAGIGGNALLVHALGQMTWDMFYMNPGRAMDMPWLHTIDPAPLLSTLPGLWTLQAIAVAARDAGNIVRSMTVLQLVEQHAHAHENAPDMHAAVAMRLARAALDAHHMAAMRRAGAAPDAQQHASDDWVRMAKDYALRARERAHAC
ncbi:MAG: hypothetical protein RMJ55_20155, partial [Roseiflexaceae bacterium]|nr:hypothetical protein [Roseiflexaceae bacterium]